MSTTTLFRVSFSDGTKAEVRAADPDQAGKQAKETRQKDDKVFILKIKRVREQEKA